MVTDGFLDAYHLQFVHPTTVGPFFHTNVYAFDAYGKHSRMVVARKGITDAALEGFDPDTFADHAITNFTIYPGTIITVEPRQFEVWTVRPCADDPRYTTVHLRFMVPEPPRSDKQTRFWDRNWDLLLETVEQEDWVVAKTISDGLATGHVEQLVYGRNEAANQHFHRQLAADLATDR